MAGNAAVGGVLNTGVSGAIGGSSHVGGGISESLGGSGSVGGSTAVGGGVHTVLVGV
ncbi:hypothetical protein L834_4142 [Mycobacteroides abscessus MAB_091912_2455]|nr:hypothetical protein L834_4142 [Mycobacteroides abscessus MAB_091912_2455]